MAALMFNFSCYFTCKASVSVALTFPRIFCCAWLQLRFSIYLSVLQGRGGHGPPCTPKGGQHPLCPHSSLKPGICPDGAPADLLWHFHAISGINQAKFLLCNLWKGECSARVDAAWKSMKTTSNLSDF